MKTISMITLLTSFAFTANAQNQQKTTIDSTAPVVQREEIFIDAHSDSVWKALTEIERWGEWNKNISETHISGNPEVGNVFTWKTNGTKIKSTIHTFEKASMIGWIGKTFGATAVHNWTIEPSEQGTRVIVEESMNGWIIKLFKKNMNKKLKSDMTHWLESLKSESEA